VSLGTLQEHRRIWNDKPELAIVYRPWFEWLLAGFPARGRVLEVGAGPGFLAAFARRARPGLRWVASELLAPRWIDVCADAGRLPFPDASFDGLAALDTLHHLPHPRGFFAEAARVLRAGAPLRLVEPWVSPLSYPVYRWLHQEGCDSSLDPWRPFAGLAAKQPFDGDAAVAGRLVTRTPESTWRELGLGLPRVTRMNGFAYLPSLGFRDGSLLTPWLAARLNRLDLLTSPLARLTALRAGLEWRRSSEVVRA
jgi:SAM-dependent methyltransferase